MSVVSHRNLFVALASVLLVSSALAVGAALGAETASQPDDQRTAYLRVVHASPDAPAVDVLVENETVLSDVPFGAVSDYLRLDAGTYDVAIAAADDPDTIVFEDEVTVDPRTVTTLTASGEITDDAETDFEPVAYADSAFTPGENDSALRVVHLSPDAPAVDVTAANGMVVLADDVSYQDASEYVTVPAGEYTVEIRAATETNDGPVVATVDVSLAGGTAYSALAVGYLHPDDAPAETPFEVVATEDATTSVHLPNDGRMAGNETES